MRADTFRSAQMKMPAGKPNQAPTKVTCTIAARIMAVVESIGHPQIGRCLPSRKSASELAANSVSIIRSARCRRRRFAREDCENDRRLRTVGRPAKPPVGVVQNGSILHKPSLHRSLRSQRRGDYDKTNLGIQATRK